METLYFAYVEDLYTMSIGQIKVEAEDDEPLKRYQLRKPLFYKKFPTTYVRYDEINTIIYPYHLCAVGYTKIAALKTLRVALQGRVKTVESAINEVDNWIATERENKPATAVV